MAVKSIVEIDLRDAKFREFAKLFDRYEKALKRQPEAWKLVTDKIDGTRSAYKKLVDSMVAANIQERLRVKAQERADYLTRSTADRWQNMARTTRTVASNIKDGTTALLKWSGVIGVLTGLLGAGGIWGIDRLALSVGGSRRTSLGLGTSIGERAAFGNFGRLIDPDQFLSAVAGAKFDVTKRVGLLGAGLTQGQIGGSTADTAVALLDQLKRIADTTNPALYAQVLQARRLDQFASPQDLERLHNTQASEYAQLRSQYANRRREFDLRPDVAKAWQDLSTQLDNAARGIQTTFVKGLAPLVPGLNKLSDSVEKTIASFLGSPALAKWLKQADEGLEKFASYVGTPQFQHGVETFVAGIGRLAEVVWNAVSWFGGGTGKRASVRDRANWGRLHGMGLKTAGELRADRASGKSTAVGQLWGIFGAAAGGGGIDQLLSIVRRSEASGDAAVSPKGAIGRYQIEPGTARQYGGDPSRLTDPAYNETIARRILSDLVRKYHGNTAEVLAAYNAGEGGSAAYRAHGDNPAFLPRETQAYVARAQRMPGYTPTVVTIENNTGGNATVSINGLKN